jgi:hypothetical protein
VQANRTIEAVCCLLAWTVYDTQASSSGEKAVVEQLRASVDLMQLQLSIANRIAAAAAGSSSTPVPDGNTPARMTSDVRALRSRCMDIDTLYNTYAQPYAQWDSCLCLCNVANTVPGEYVRQLWDLLLKQAWEGAVGADGAVDSDVRLTLCCERTQELGAKFYPNDNRCVWRPALEPQLCCIHMHGFAGSVHSGSAMQGPAHHPKQATGSVFADRCAVHSSACDEQVCGSGFPLQI